MIPAPFSGSALAKRYLTCQVLITLAGAMLVFMGMRISPGTFPEQFPEVSAPAASAQNPLAGCERLASGAVDKLTKKSIDDRSDEWRRERQSAAQSCLNDFAKFDSLKNSM
jgi:hypothetical protein